jgi:prepilin signal peptidase PulO-like enzyme (type II secretory pathway)
MGWYCRASAPVKRLVEAAGGDRRAQQTRQTPASCARWALAAALATGGVVAAVPDHGPTALPPLVTSSLAVWAGALAVLALIDRESLVLPTKFVRTATLLVTSLLVAGASGPGDRRYLWHGMACALVAGAVFGAWAVSNPRGLGFGDARMACLVALGAGTLSLSGSLVALSCSPFVAGLVGKHRARHTSGPTAGAGRAAVALGPYLAVGGLMVVVFRAF